MKLFIIFISSILVNNFVLSNFLGICPFIGVSKKIDAAFSMGVAVTFVMVLTAIVTWLIDHLILMKLGISVYMQNVSFILVIAALVQFVEMFIKKTSPALYKTLGIFLPLITTNCAILGLALLQSLNGYTFIQSIVFGVGAGIGFTIAISIMAGIREQLEFSDVPHYFKGAPITLISAGILALAFMGFTGMFTH